MDITQANLIALLSSPVSFGILISLIWEQTAYFQNKDNPPIIKILLVVFTSLIWSVAMAWLSPSGLPSTAQGWYNVLLTGIAVAFSTQLFHQIVNNYAPGIGDFLFGLKATTTTTAATNTDLAATVGTLKIATGYSTGASAYKGGTLPSSDPTTPVG